MYLPDYTLVYALLAVHTFCTYPASSAFLLHSTYLNFDPLHFCTFNCTAITTIHDYTRLHFTRPAHILHEAALILHPPHSTCTQYALTLRSCLHFYLNLHLSCILRMLLALNMHSYCALACTFIHPLHSCTFNCTAITRLATLNSTCTYPAFSAFYLHSICTIVAACLHFDPLHSCTLHACTQPALLSPLREVLNPLELLHSTYTHSTCTSLSSWLFDPLELPVLNLHSAYMHSTCTPLSLLLDPLELPVLNMHSSRGYT